MHLFGTTSTEQDFAQTPIQIEACIKQIASGDRAALAELYAGSRSAVYGFALSIVKNSKDAEDVLQDTFLKIWSAAEGYQSMGKPMAWILTIVRNLATSKLRERGKTVEMPEDEQLYDATHDPSFGIEQRVVLEAAMRELGNDERQIVMLHAISGLKHIEIARMLSMPLSTVLSKYSRALRKLQRALEEGKHEKK
ncbi:MAG: RNA polymerase sigma factor [Clostridiales bacterium]|nr:RNA polymerase sigma factor [Clostridiales bacterium]